MKKNLFLSILIVIALLAACTREEPEPTPAPQPPVETEIPEEPEEPDEPGNPDTPDNPDNPDEPGEPEDPDTPDNPDEPENPENPDTPDNPEDPENPENPENPDTPDNPDTPGTPDEPTVDPPVVRQFYAAAHAESGLPVRWTAGGSASLFCSAGSNIQVGLTVEGQDEVSFLIDDAASFPDRDDYIVLYPYQKDASFSSGVLVSEFPAVQEPDFPGFCVARASGQAPDAVELEFRNLYSVLSVPVKGKGQKVKALEFRGNNNEIVAGRCGVSDFNHPFTAMNLMGGSHTLILNLPAAVEMSATPTVFKMAIPCITFSKGVTIRVLTENAEDTQEFELPDVGTFSSPLTRNAETAVSALELTGDELEWSPGCLLIDENGYRFSNTDSANPTEPYGMLFQFEAVYGIPVAMDTATPGSDVKASGGTVWRYNEETGKGETLTAGAWLDHGALTQGDLCAKVPVSDGENRWRMPTEEEALSWTLVSSNNTVTLTGFSNQSVYAVVQAGSQQLRLFPSGYTVSKGTLSSSDWIGFWLQPDEDYLEKERTKFILFKPAARFNSSNPNMSTCEATSYKIVPSGGKYRTPAMQYRCCRIKKRK